MNKMKLHYLFIIKYSTFHYGYENNKNKIKSHMATNHITIE